MIYLALVEHLRFIDQAFKGLGEIRFVFVADIIEPLHLVIFEVENESWKLCVYDIYCIWVISIVRNHKSWKAHEMNFK